MYFEYRIVKIEKVCFLSSIEVHLMELGKRLKTSSSRLSQRQKLGLERTWFNEVKRIDKLYIPGDLVYILGSPRIISNCDGYYATYYDENESLQEVNVNVIEGIPLTPEILEKNGWKLSHGFYWSPNEEGAEVGLSSQTGYVWNAYMRSYTLRSGINSVSDLQHLLFGLGLNSEMEV